MATEGFKFTHDERRVLRDKLYDLVTKASMTPNEVIQTIEELLTKRAIERVRKVDPTGISD